MQPPHETKKCDHKMQTPSELFLDKLAQAIFDKNGENILALDVRGISTMTDYLLIAEGNVGRHLDAIMRHLLEIAQNNEIKPLQIEGNNESDWVVVDFGDVMVHLFIPEVRQHYALEELWSEGKIVDLHIKV